MKDEKRHKGLEITIYISLIIPAGIVAQIFYLDITGAQTLDFTFFAILFLYAFAVSLLLSVIGFFMCSRLLRRRLLLWYGCLFGCLFALTLTQVFVDQFIYSENLATFILSLGAIVLLTLPVVGLWKTFRS